MPRQSRLASVATATASVLLALACLGIIGARHDETLDRAATERAKRDPFESYLARFSALERELRGVEVVGYAPLPSAASSPHHDVGFFRAQYALAPVIVDASTEHRYVVGNFHTTRQWNRFVRSSRLKVVRDFRNGVVLFENDDVR